MRRLAPLLLLAAAAAPAPDPAVYTCRVDVTGTRERPFAQCLRGVLVKLSARPALAEDPRVADDAGAAPAVTDFVFLDAMTDIPLRDEQGTRDRPFEFLGHVDPVAAGQALDRLGIPAWTAPRPVLSVRVSVVDRAGNRFALTGDGARGERQRRALLDAASRFALRVALPPAGTDTPAPSPVLAGALWWSEADFGWNADWHLAGEAEGWGVRGVSFDAAFRAGVGGAATRLSAAGGR